jgi:hypothetical protein
VLVLVEVGSTKPLRLERFRIDLLVTPIVSWDGVARRKLRPKELQCPLSPSSELAQDSGQQ